MQSVIDTLNGAWPAADWSVSGNAMRWTPPQPELPEQTANPGEMLPLVPDDRHPPGAVRLRVLVDGSLYADAHLREQLLQLADEMDRISRMRRVYRRKRGRGW